MNELMKDFLLGDDPVGELFKLDEKGRMRELDDDLANLRMDIPKGFHHKDNLTHSIQVLENAITREDDGPDLILRTAALYHDVGKPATRSFKGGSVSFWNHEVVGARMMPKILRGNGFTKSDEDQVQHLVALHMRGYGFGDVTWSDSGVRRLIRDAGSEVALLRLIKIFYSDLTSKSPRVVARVTAGIARLEEALRDVMAADERALLRPALDGNQIMAITGLKPGRELGVIMKFLNQDEHVGLEADAALDLLASKFPEHFL